ncbi:MAG: hypothetical protein G3M78_07065 [Candidatus Nitrohelix vancouverensis]|uniref:DUF998 domain-containing protein n=1 Tax=Candidatus Nitrohelix vancouverensis TaxID=2705534 RepID=A0A7T0G3E4_9BACT|nr:MAG: hypothetical protein G3M78_07065 [Candidatus Nitrohelix vancouverensis]
MKTLPTKTILCVLLACDLLFLLLHSAYADHSQIGTLIDLGGEGNLPTWYSSFKFTLAAIAALACGYDSAQRSPRENNFSVYGWFAVAVLMLAMSADETGQVHETATRWIMQSEGGQNLRDYFGVSEAGGALLWVVLLSPLLLGIGGALCIFYYLQFRSTPHLFKWAVVMTALFVFAAVLETVQAKLFGSAIDAQSLSRYKTLSNIEEMSELAGSSLLVWIHISFFKERQ